MNLVILTVYLNYYWILLYNYIKYIKHIKHILYISFRIVWRLNKKGLKYLIIA